MTDNTHAKTLEINRANDIARLATAHDRVTRCRRRLDVSMATIKRELDRDKLDGREVSYAFRTHRSDVEALERAWISLEETQRRARS